MRIILTSLILFITISGNAQSPKDDEVVFEASVDWLNNKLDYLYFDNVSQKWWTNTFYVNDNKEVTIKQISSKNPQSANIKEKTYTIRKFRIQDINPFTIQIKEVKASTGRFVEGQLLEIHTFDGENKIHKTINNRKATSTSFLHLVFPKTMTDSLSNYPELVKEKFKDAVISATKIYPIDQESNRTFIMETLEGEYLSENGEKWLAKERFDGILKIESESSEQFFGFDESKNQFFLTSISSTGVRTEYFKIANDIQLIIENGSNASHKILFDTFNSFQLNEVWYYRQ